MTVAAKKTSGRRSRLAILFLVLALLGSPNLACDHDSGPAAAVGQSRIKLLEPEGLIRIGEESPHYRDLIDALGGESGNQILAFYTDPISWQAFTYAITPKGPTVPLDFYAFIANSKDLGGRDFSEKEFTETTKNKVLPALSSSGARLLAEGSRYFTFQIDQKHPYNDEEYCLTMTYILVEKKLLTMVVNASPTHRSRAEKVAQDWRDGYLKQTKP